MLWTSVIRWHWWDDHGHTVGLFQWVMLAVNTLVRRGLRRLLETRWSVSWHFTTRSNMLDMEVRLEISLWRLVFGLLRSGEITDNRFFENRMELSWDEWQIDNVGDGRSKDRSTYLKKPGRIRLFVRTVEENLRYVIVRFRCWPERR